MGDSVQNSVKNPVSWIFLILEGKFERIGQFIGQFEMVVFRVFTGF